MKYKYAFFLLETIIYLIVGSYIFVLINTWALTTIKNIKIVAQTMQSLSLAALVHLFFLDTIGKAPCTLSAWELLLPNECRWKEGDVECTLIYNKEKQKLFKKIKKSGKATITIQLADNVKESSFFYTVRQERMIAVSVKYQHNQKEYQFIASPQA